MYKLIQFLFCSVLYYSILINNATANLSKMWTDSFSYRMKQIKKLYYLVHSINLLKQISTTQNKYNSKQVQFKTSTTQNKYNSKQAQFKTSTTQNKYNSKQVQFKTSTTQNKYSSKQAQFKTSTRRTMSVSSLLASVQATEIPILWLFYIMPLNVQ